MLETTFITAGGTVRVTNALPLPDTASPAPGRELARRIEGLAGSVPMRWSIPPRFGYGAHIPHVARRVGVPVATYGSEAVAVCACTPANRSARPTPPPPSSGLTPVPGL